MNIITLTLNPAFDIHCYTESFAPYHENLADITSFDAGGKGVNISRALISLGVDNTALIVLGSENADTFKRALVADKIDHIAVETAGRIRENITLHTSGSPETRISFRGFEADPSLLSLVEEAIESSVCSDTVLTFTGSLPTGISASEAREMLLRMKKRGARIVIDSRSFTLDDISAVRPWLIKPNEEEISMYSSRKADSLNEAAIVAKELRESCADNVMISLGGAGAVLACEAGCFAANAPSVEVRSTIGAGDSSIGGFIAGASKGLSYAEMLKYAVCCGSAACMTEGTKPPKKENVEALLTKVNIQKYL